jgi:nicotinamidase-related amidase
VSASGEPAIGGRVGFGERPALVVIDMSRAFTDPESPIGTNLDATVSSIARILDVARAGGDAPITFTTVVYGERERGAARVMLRKWAGAAVCEPGSRWVEIDPRLAPRGGETVIEKVFPSAFFGTTLATELITGQRDSVIIIGASTSGCVRASAVDAVSYGFQVIVPREAVGDRDPQAHEQSLADIDLKYGDVVSEQDAIEWLGGAASGLSLEGSAAEWPVGGR